MKGVTEMSDRFADFTDDDLEAHANRLRLRARGKGQHGCTTDEALERVERAIERTEKEYRAALMSFRHGTYTRADFAIPSSLLTSYIAHFDEEFHDDLRTVVREPTPPGYSDPASYPTREERDKDRARMVQEAEELERELAARRERAAKDAAEREADKEADRIRAWRETRR